MSNASDKLSWYWNRLRLMSVGEVGYRCRQSAAKTLHRLRDSSAPVPPPRNTVFGAPWCSVWPKGLDVQVYTQAADFVLDGKWNVFALRGVDLGFPPRWNVDPLTGTVAPMTHGKTLNYRDERLVGNIKYLWEPSRHLELTTLAQAYRLTGEVRYLEACRSFLNSWVAQCPYPLGVHWASALELAIRLVNWAVVWHLVGGQSSVLFAGNEGQALLRLWLEQVYRHAEFIQGFFSRYSSANNHLLGEYMGLFIAGVTWPCWDEAERWRAQGCEGFEREALLQNFADGVNREQAVYYHHEVADMMLICGLFGRANGTAFSDQYWSRLEAMLGFLAAIRNSGGKVPMFGDSDDALMVRFDPRPDFDPYRSLLATGAALFGRTDFSDEKNSDDKTSWLLGDGQRLRVMSSVPIARAFPQGGYWVLGNDFGQPDEVHIVANAGPLGYLSLAAHGHADALSFVLSVGGVEILVDPGTFAYHTKALWRNYFRGTSAHNTVRVDGVDQSVIGGNFMWLAKAESSCLSFDVGASKDTWVAEHEGYKRLAQAVVHRRAIELDKRARRITVTDTLSGVGQHTAELYWHFAEACEVEVDGAAGLRAVVEECAVRFQFQMPNLELSLHCGESEPPLGWVSRSFDVKVPTTTARCRMRVDGTTNLITQIAY